MKTILSVIMVLGLMGTVASADATKGQKLYLKKLKSSCGMSGAKMAAKHSQDEWEAIHNAGKLTDEIKDVCPNAKDGALKERYLPHYFDFFYEYANDSGSVPSC